MFHVKPFSRKKSATHAEREKECGNRHFKEKKYRQAVCSYSQTVVRAPQPGDPDAGDILSVGYANRSAALLHMGEFRLCLQDIEAALGAGYPARLRYKLLDRRATCQLKLGHVTAARETLKELPEALKEADLDSKKREVWEKDVQKKAESAAKMQDFKPIMLQQEEELPALESRSDHFLSASSAVDVTYSPGEGRFAVAARDVKPGDLLVVEKTARVRTYGGENRNALVLAAFPCRECSGVMFCSPACAAAAEPYHRWECSIQDVLQASGMSPLCHLALRIITKHGLEFFQKLRPELERARAPGDRPSTDSAGKQYDPDNYLSVHQLVTLSELRKPEDFFHRTLMAVLLLKHLRVAGFFGEVTEDDPADRALSSDELLVGSLLLHHLQLLQFNAHEVGEYVMMEPGQFKQSRSVYIGVAVYPTVSFFNHSCEGGVSRCFVGDTLVVHSVMPVAAGQPIFENYGPIYSHKAKPDRQHWLSSRYWFDCRCVACEENWPDYDQYDINTVLLRCTGCGAGIENDASGKDPVGDCPKCGKKNNAVELFRQMRGAQENYHSAMNMMHEGEPKKALRLFYRFIEQCQELVVRPNRDLSLCQEAARMCLAAQGSLHCIRQKKTNVA
ncbi:SET and MYND domain-containing protein 4-like [Amphibalanus amphitrite]|uniref:SET and MYND domain-containing protein 4-like n=1 Tax=Amphibalanus amphitrite TaxID=1232801 RepID=UPI001C910EE6|nr:SET and MYND domain-containing protein 4-like [Amphibalanus amphitrite]